MSAPAVASAADTADAGSAASARRRLAERCAAAARALAGDAGLHWRGGRPYRGARPLALHGPHLHPPPGDDADALRGAADAVALRVAGSDEALHRSLCPADPLERWLFEWLEQCRVESLPRAALPGVARNLRRRFEQWSLVLHRDGLTDGATGLLLYTVVQASRARVTGEPVVEATDGVIEATRAAVAPVLGAALAGLRRERADQAAYAVHALALARLVGALVADARAQAGDDGEEEADPRRRGPALLLDFDDDGEAAGADAAPGGRGPAAGGGYRIHTTTHDAEVRAATRVRAALLAEYRAQLDRRIAAQGLNVPRLARRLQALLAVPASDGWDDGLEEGRIDGRRLARLVGSPGERRLFRAERRRPAASCVVGFLVDCSGSMRRHVDAVALLVDVLVRALEQAGAASELLGYTTGAWNGGRAAADWQRAGRPPRPGRLNEVCHLIFKDADTPWQRARRDIAALLKADLFREGIDGEAVEWACRRLEARGESRRLLVVISDGCPADTATGLANDPHYLERHLREVLLRREREGRVEIRGLGIGADADAGAFHRRALAVDASLPVGDATLLAVADLLGGR